MGTMSDPAVAASYIREAQSLLDLALVALEGETPVDAPIYSTAIQDRDARPKPDLPALGPAGSSFVDPCFGSTITRVTDGVGGSFHVASNAHVASWNADSSRFYLLGPDGKQVYALVDGNVRPFCKVSSQCEPTFSRIDPAVIYGVGGPVTRTIQASTIGADGKVTVADLLDLDTLGLQLVEPRTYVGGMVSSDVSLAFFFGGTGQDKHHYAAVLPNGMSEPLVIDTLTEPGCGFLLHSISIDRTGRFVVRYPIQAKPFPMGLWDLELGTFTPVTEAEAPWGHDTQGYGIEINHDTAPNGQEWDAAQWVIRRLHNIVEVADLITPVLRPKEVYMDDHASWHNARPDVMLPVITATYRYNDEAAPWRAWDDEVFAIATEGVCTVYRFCHHRSDCRDEEDPKATHFWYQPIPSVSPDGRWVLFGSNWEKTLGPDPLSANEGQLRSRTDVFLVLLPD